MWVGFTVGGLYTSHPTPRTVAVVFIAPHPPVDGPLDVQGRDTPTVVVTLLWERKSDYGDGQMVDGA